MYPSMLALQPDIAAAMLEYRLQRIPGAEAKAASYDPPYSGAMFPWESALTGLEVCPTWAGTGLREIHINGDIAMAVWAFWRSLQDNGNSWLNTTGYPILSGIADFWVSRMLVDNPGAVVPGWPAPPVPAPDAGTMALHIDNVIPPDEYADHVNDSVYTNVGARLTVTYAVAAAQLLGRPASEYAAWANVSSRIVIPFNASWPGMPGGLHPEYDGYFNATIKQADVILLGFPLHLDAFGNNSAAVRANDLAWYGPVTDPGGPAMTWGMFASGYAALGDVATAATYLNASFANAQPPFAVWTETPTGGTPNFLTGAGGFMQVPLFGYPRLVMNDTAFTLDPLLFPGATSAKLRGFSYLGARLDIEYSADALSITVQTPTPPARLRPAPTHTYAPLARPAVRAVGPVWAPTAPLAARSQRGQTVIAGYRVAATPLVVVDAAGGVHALTPGTPVTLPLQAVTVMPAATQ